MRCNLFAWVEIRSDIGKGEIAHLDEADDLMRTLGLSIRRFLCRLRMCSSVAIRQRTCAKSPRAMLELGIGSYEKSRIAVACGSKSSVLQVTIRRLFSVAGVINSYMEFPLRWEKQVGKNGRRVAREYYQSR